MGDRIIDLPVDHIVPSTDEKQILDSMFVPSAPRPTTSVRMNVSSANPEPVPQQQLGTSVSFSPIVPDVGDSHPPNVHHPQALLPVKNPLKQEIRSAVLLAVLFVLCAMPYMDRFLGAMMPFLQRSPIASLASKTVLFMMIAYIMLNWEMLRATPSQQMTTIG